MHASITRVTGFTFGNSLPGNRSKVYVHATLPRPHKLYAMGRPYIHIPCLKHHLYEHEKLCVYFILRNRIKSVSLQAMGSMR